jgi:hypothetical protein
MIQKDWFDYCIKNDASRDQLFDILEDWKKDRENLLEIISHLEKEKTYSKEFL